MKNKLIAIIMLVCTLPVAAAVFKSNLPIMEITSVANQSSDRVRIKGLNYDNKSVTLEVAPSGKIIGEDLRNINPRHSVSVTVLALDSPSVITEGSLVMQLEGNSLATTLSRGIVKEGDLDGAALLKIVVTEGGRIFVGPDMDKRIV